MKLKYIALLFFIPLLLIGCTEEWVLESDNNLVSVNADIEVDADVDVDTSTELEFYPENVQNGTVSVKMYSEAMRFIKSVTDHLNHVNSYQKELNDNFMLYRHDAEFHSNFKKAIDDSEVFIKGVHVTPTTEADFEINNNFSEILYYYPLMLNSHREYLNSYEQYHMDNVVSYSNTMKTSFMAMVNTVEKYGLFSDSQ